MLALAFSLILPLHGAAGSDCDPRDAGARAGVCQGEEPDAAPPAAGGVREGELMCVAAHCFPDEPPAPAPDRLGHMPACLAPARAAADPPARGRLPASDGAGDSGFVPRLDRPPRL